MAGKTAEQTKAAEEAKAKAKAANAAKKAEHAAKITTPDPALEAAAAQADAAKGSPDATETDGQGSDGDVTEAETLAAKALDGGELNAEEVRQVAARALGKGDDFEGAMLALAVRLEVVEQKIVALTDENTKIMKRVRAAKGVDAKDPTTLHGSVDDLGGIG